MLMLDVWMGCNVGYVAMLDMLHCWMCCNVGYVGYVAMLDTLDMLQCWMSHAYAVQPHLNSVYFD
jgi:hypothetical protein